MINFIIYEDNKKWQEKYHEAIMKVIGKRKDKYHITIIDHYQKETQILLNNLIGKKIYLLDLEVPGKTGLELAREIRFSNDWLSPIIIITQYAKFRNEGFTSKVLMLDFITKKVNIENQIINALETALQITTNQKSYSFTYENELYQIPYSDILYFEKDLNQNYTNIITKNESFKIKKSIANIENELFACLEFYKTHRSCIVNLNNIKKISWKDNTIYFLHHEINLLARNRKKTLKEKLARRYEYDPQFN